MRLKNKTGVVTGGGSGIGRGICIKLAEEGAKVAIADIDMTGADETLRLIREIGGEAICIRADVTSVEESENMIAEAVNEFGRIDILVNNAGTDIKGSIQDYPVEKWDFLMSLNLKGVFLSTQAAVKRMLDQKYGRIVNISSMAGKTGEAYTSPYCTTKFGVIGFTQSIALELGESNITVNAVCPGAVETDLIKQSVSGTAELNNRSYEEELYEKFIKQTPLGRVAQPSDIANAVAFLASDEASFITGSTLNVSGGREMH
ncbi:SDR family oxidoreductase [Halomonas sp. ATCH28]|uniref:SDR family oxidoreductase n=1 Tax=Halomonas gemina TaxID=2945105 RepID=A0ABT0T189_9GAMM|nr:SDR family NAD(P)-dependent oxidoreductase [Halomonas gemina]MCL7940552.1 SDR family oxidoreductase [Halomonas gemina]